MKLCSLPWLVGASLALALAPAAPAQERAPATVEVRATALFVLHGPVGSLDAQERARVTNDRIDRIPHDPSLDPRLIAVRVLPDRTPTIAVGQLSVVKVSPEDSRAAAVPRDVLAERWAAALRSRLAALQPLYTSGADAPRVKTLREHRVLLLILQVAILLLSARLCGEVALRLGQPPVIGQLLAGILLGRSVLGALWPDLKTAVFPIDATQSYLLEVVSWLGVLFLLLAPWCRHRRSGS